MPFAAEGAQLYGGVAACWIRSDRRKHVAPCWNGGVARSAGAPVGLVFCCRLFSLTAVGEDGVETAVTCNLKVPARVNRLSFAFFAASLQRQDRLRFRWKLDGFDKDWTTAGSSRLATYTNLPPGHYRFRVVASDPARPGLLAEADIALAKESYFFQTWWFYLLCAIALAGLAWPGCCTKRACVR